MSWLPIIRQRLHLRLRRLCVSTIANNPSCSNSSSCKSFSTAKLNCGIVGLPNVGKSTLFNALVGSQAAQAANYPFCTIEPNVGLVSVPDTRLDKLGVINKSEKVVPAAMEFVDIAGIVKGASEGEGLGNQCKCSMTKRDQPLLENSTSITFPSLYPLHREQVSNKYSGNGRDRSRRPLFFK